MTSATGRRPIHWGLVGGGRDSQIGEAHRIAARLDNRFVLAAGALDIDPERGRAFAGELGISPERAHGTWRDMLAAEKSRRDRLGLVAGAATDLHVLVSLSRDPDHIIHAVHP